MQKPDADNNKADYAAILLALGSGKRVRFYINDNDTTCLGQFVHIVPRATLGGVALSGGRGSRTGAGLHRCTCRRRIHKPLNLTQMILRFNPLDPPVARAYQGPSFCRFSSTNHIGVGVEGAHMAPDG